MRLFVFACAPLRPYLEKLLPSCPHEVEIYWLANESRVDVGREVRDRLLSLKGHDAVILAGGGCFVPEDGLSAGEIPLVIPRVHNVVSLLLGGAQPYRALFERFEGRIGWVLPGTPRPLLDCPEAECACLCYLADTTLGLPDESLSAQMTARAQGWDFFSAEGDPSLLEALLLGQWEDERVAVVTGGETARLSYDRGIIG